MRIVIQRVSQASVTIGGQLHSEIGQGMMVLVGVREDDSLDDVKWLAAKTAALRIYDDENGVMNPTPDAANYIQWVKDDINKCAN